MNEPPAPALLDEERPSARDVWEVARLPGLIAIITAAATWLIWYYTNTPCTPELAARTNCNPAEIARYINVDVFGRILTYSAITAAAGGVWNYNMFTKMRAQIAAERQRADAAIQQLAEYRQQMEEERRQVEKERWQAAEERRQAAEQRQQAAEERQLRMEEEFRRSEEERRTVMQQNAELNRAMLAALTELTAEIVRLRQERNGNGAREH